MLNEVNKMKKFQEIRDVIASPDNKFYKLLKKLDQREGLSLKLVGEHDGLFFYLFRF